MPPFKYICTAQNGDYREHEFEDGNLCHRYVLTHDTVEGGWWAWKYTSETPESGFDRGVELSEEQVYQLQMALPKEA